jgi:hypothetical protein
MIGTLERQVDRGLAWFGTLSNPVQDRVVGVLIGPPAAVVLAIALRLEPNPAGVGTHQQLGLSPCSVLSFTGWPCPMCGMTTTFAHLAHGHLIDGTLNQPFGLVLFSCAVLCAIIGLADLAHPRGRWRPVWDWMIRHETLVAVVLLGGMIGGWLYKAILLRGLG